MREIRPHDRAKFVRLANRRVPAAVKAIDLVGNLSVRSNYDFTEEDAKQVVTTLKAAVRKCEDRFAGKTTAAQGFELKG